MQDVESVLISREQIRARVAELAAEITEDYRDTKPLTLVCILKGASLFFTDLFRQVDLDASIDFMAISSYGSATKSTGVVRINKDLDSAIEGKHVLIVEDIVDSGLSLSYLIENLETRNPASIRICCLLDKPERRKKPVAVQYTGFTIPDAFVIGYGLDYDERYRNLEDICILSPRIYAE